MSQQTISTDNIQPDWSSDFEDQIQSLVEQAKLAQSTAQLQVETDLLSYGQAHHIQPKRKGDVTDFGDTNDACSTNPKLICKDDGIEFGKRPPILSESEW